MPGVRLVYEFVDRSSSQHIEPSARKCTVRSPQNISQRLVTDHIYSVLVYQSSLAAWKVLIWTQH